MKNKGVYDEAQLKSLPYYKTATKVEGDTARLKEFILKCKSGKDVTVVSIGGSVTQGESASSNDKNYPALIGKWISERYGIKVNSINAGCNGTGSVIGVERVERDVLSQKPDLVIVEFSVNDGDNDLDMEAYESLILRLLTDENRPAVMHFAMCGRDKRSSERIHRVICEHYNIPLISLIPFMEWEKDTSPYFKDGVHPVDLGFEVLCNLITMKLCDVEANLDEIGEALPLPQKLTNAGMTDCKAMDVKDIPNLEWGAWYADGFDTVCTTAGGAPLEFKTDCSYILIKYEQNNNLNAKIKIVIDGNEDDAKIICNNGFYYNIVADFCKEKEPNCHEIKIYMTEGDKFKMSTAYLSNFI